ncbi:DUF2470 domain-containing protein [Streptomyces sp. TRM66268-LWL]|uniref:DUF2470 domain-containing protein n=1 Tax=Streptomyces polyasparticus TaxID=2767826 RepID=A0ABR7SC95_9ACTN|nr:DUF2470 domain-containing protein [Streptomyces polyasparticus]MBC9713101.1 DUF2470 domain-containing protein [Streptomyces polyasparticus]
MRLYRPRTPQPDPAERVRALEPTAAERVRTLLATAHSMSVVADGRAEEVHRLDGSDAMGHVHLHDPAEAALHPEARRTPVRLEFTDIAPTAVRDRLRARLTVTGILEAPYAAHATESFCMEYGQALLETERGRTFVTLQELHACEADPLAACEAGMLTHLVDRHSELVPLLVRLVRPYPRPGLLRVLPVALDRYGMTLRLEYADTHTDARLPFSSPVDHPDEVRPQIHALLDATRRAPYGSGLRT